jgi:hypothetical protein
MSAYTSTPTPLEHPTAATKSGTRVVGPDGEKYTLRKLDVRGVAWSLNTLCGKLYDYGRNKRGWTRVWYLFSELALDNLPEEESPPCSDNDDESKQSEKSSSTSPFQQLVISLCKNHTIDTTKDIEQRTYLLNTIEKKLEAVQISLSGDLSFPEDTWCFDSNAHSELEGTTNLTDLSVKATEFFDRFCLCEYCNQPDFEGQECECRRCYDCGVKEDQEGTCECGNYIGDCFYCEIRCKSRWDNGYLRDGTLYCRPCGKGEPWAYEAASLSAADLKQSIDYVMYKFNIWQKFEAWNEDDTKTTEDLNEDFIPMLMGMYSDGIHVDDYCHGEYDMLDVYSDETLIGEHVRIHMLAVAKEKLASIFYATVVLKRFAVRYVEYCNAPGGVSYHKARARFEKMSNLKK